MKYQYIQGLLDTPHPTGKIPLTVQVGRQAGKVLRRGWAISTTREYRPGNKPQGHCPEYPVWHVHSKANRSIELYSNGSRHRWKMGLICASWSHRQVIACSRVWPWCTGCYKHCSIITTWIAIALVCGLYLSYMEVGTEYACSSVRMFGGTGQKLEIKDGANRNRVLKAISNTLRYLALEVGTTSEACLCDILCCTSIVLAETNIRRDLN
jgi:hypothetical protein